MFTIDDVEGQIRAALQRFVGDTILIFRRTDRQPVGTFLLWTIGVAPSVGPMSAEIDTSDPKAVRDAIGIPFAEFG
jgi:hypothetical protein